MKKALSTAILCAATFTAANTLSADTWSKEYKGKGHWAHGLDFGSYKASSKATLNEDGSKNVERVYQLENGQTTTINFTVVHKDPKQHEKNRYRLLKKNRYDLFRTLEDGERVKIGYGKCYKFSLLPGKCHLRFESDNVSVNEKMTMHFHHVHRKGVKKVDGHTYYYKDRMYRVHNH